MHHAGHTQGGGCPKCIINTRQIAPLAVLFASMDGSNAATTLADTATAAVGVLDAFGLTAQRPPKEPCEHAVKIMSWISGTQDPDQVDMETWTGEILADIAEMIGGAGS